MELGAAVHLVDGLSVYGFQDRRDSLVQYILVAKFRELTVEEAKKLPGTHVVG